MFDDEIPEVHEVSEAEVEEWVCERRELRQWAIEQAVTLLGNCEGTADPEEVCRLATRFLTFVEDLGGAL